MWKYIYDSLRKGVHIMTTLVISIKRTLQSTSTPISIKPNTNYHRHAPKSAEQLMRDNWRTTGNSLYNAIKKVGDEIEKR